MQELHENGTERWVDADQNQTSARDSGPTAGVAMSAGPPTDLVAAATDLFTSNGYATTTVASIARLAGCSPGTVYNHFANKAHVFAVCYRFAWSEVIERVHTHTRDDRADSVLALIAIARKHPHLVMLANEATSALGPRRTDLEREACADALSVVDRLELSMVANLVHDQLVSPSSVVCDSIVRALISGLEIPPKESPDCTAWNVDPS